MNYDSNFFDASGTMLPGVTMGPGDTLVVVNGSVTIARAWAGPASATTSTVMEAPARKTRKPRQTNLAKTNPSDNYEQQSRPGRQSKQKREMTFIDDKRIPSDPIDEVARAKFTRAPTRPAVKPVKVVCQRCNQKLSVSPSLAKPDYVCDDCLTR